MNKIIVVVANNNECIESLKKAGDSIGVEIKSEIQSEGKIINELSVNDIKDALINPLYIDEIKIDSLGRPSQRFIGEKATVNVNPQTGTIATIWKTGKNKINKYKRK